MAETNFPNGISIPAAHVGSVTPNVTATGAREAWGTTIVPSGTAGTAVSSGLTTVTYVVCSPYQASGVPAAGFSHAAASPASGGSLQFFGVSGAGTASTANGTVAWRAVGT